MSTFQILDALVDGTHAAQLLVFEVFGGVPVKYTGNRVTIVHSLKENSTVNGYSRYFGAG